MNNLKDLINEICVGADGKLKSISSRKSYWEKKGHGAQYDAIVEQTHFLDVDEKFSCRIWHVLNDKDNRIVCANDGCGNAVKWQAKGYGEFCSRKCSANSTSGKAHRSITMASLNSDEDFQNKRKDGVERYIGSEEYTERREGMSEQALALHREGILSDGLRKYFSESFHGSSHYALLRDRLTNNNPTKDPLVVEKIANTKEERYGNPRYNNAEKIGESHMARFRNGHVSREKIEPENFDKMLDNEWLYEVTRENKVSDVAKMLDVSETTLRKYMKCHDITCGLVRSGLELQVANILDDIGIEYKISERKLVPPYEIDFVIPSHRIAIECNGTYWHSEKSGKGRNYHLYKSDRCAELGYKLIHVWEHQMLKTPDLVAGRLRAKFGKGEKVYARKCKVQQVSKGVLDAFLDEHHIQGKCQSSVNYGLTIDEKVVAVMTFSKSRFSKKYDYELVRYCSVTGMNVIGGASKLFTHFLRNTGDVSVVSYCDQSWNDGNLYAALGFNKVSNSQPSYKYTKDYRNTFSRMQFQKHRLPSLLEHFDPELSEWENMQANGYDRIWDCGNTVWVWEK